MAYAASGWVSVEGKNTDFDRLFIREYSKVAAIAYRVLTDRDEAEDVAQEVFYSFYTHHEPDASYAAAWLYRAAAHTALNVVRGKQRRARRETSVEQQRRITEDGVDPQRALENAEQHREVHTALARLPKKSATVLVLRYSGLSYAEVASALDVKIGQIGTLLRRAEAAFKKEISNATPR